MSKKQTKSAYIKSDDPNFYDYIVKPAAKGKLLNKKILLILFYVLFAGGFCAICIALRVIPLMCLVLVLSCILIYFTWRYTCPEYMYYFEGPNIYFAVIYGGITRKEIFDFHIKDARIIAPYKGEYKEYADGLNDAEKYFLISCHDAENIYFAICDDGDKNKKAVFFEATPESLKRLKYYNENTVI